MEIKDIKIYIASISNITNKLKFYGDANLNNVTLLKLIYKYSSYSITSAQLNQLDKMVNNLQRIDSSICTETLSAKSYIDGALAPITVSIGASDTNSPPVSSGISITVINQNKFFTSSLFDAAYADTTPRGNVIIKSLPTGGTLSYNAFATTTAVPVTVGQSISNPSLLLYTRGVETAYGDSFTYSVLDTDPQLPLESNISTVTITVEAIELVNQSATIGDKSVYENNRFTTVFTLADFSAINVAPFYTDPEGDALNAIRIDEISSANLGAYFYYGSPLIEGQVITAADLNASAFYHVAADINSAQTDVIKVSVRDEGSMIWIS
jgi:hypothetical protein